MTSVLTRPVISVSKGGKVLRKMTLPLCSDAAATFIQQMIEPKGQTGKGIPDE